MALRVQRDAGDKQHPPTPGFKKQNNRGFLPSAFSELVLLVQPFLEWSKVVNDG